MIRGFLLIMGLFASFTILSSCDVPRGAARESEVLSKFKGKDPNIAVYKVNKDIFAKTVNWPKTGATRSDGWIRHRKGPTSSIIASGDRLNLSIWDSDQNSLLTTLGQKTVKMNEVEVSPDGTIFVPYLDRIYVSGLTTDKARATIQHELEKIVASAQVQLSLVSGRRNSVDLVGGVSKAGNYPLPDRNFTVLSLISAGGGVPKTLRNPQIRLMRGTKIYTNSISNLYTTPELDTTLRGGDKVIVAEDARYFLSLGATNKETLIYFEKNRVSVLDAMSLIGGLSDTRANPKGVLILREYAKKAVSTDGTGPSKQRVVFTVDLTSADGLFSAGKFAINPGDVILATESPVTALKTILGLLRTTLAVRNQF